MSESSDDTSILWTSVTDLRFQMAIVLVAIYTFHAKGMMQHTFLCCLYAVYLFSLSLLWYDIVITLRHTVPTVYLILLITPREKQGSF